MERPITRKRKAEETARLQTEIAEDLVELEAKISRYWSIQDVYGSAHDRRLLSTIRDRAIEMRNAWISYVEVDVMQPNTNDTRFVNIIRQHSRDQYYPIYKNDQTCHEFLANGIKCGYTPYHRCPRHFLVNPERCGKLNELDYPMVEGNENYTRDPNGLPVMATITEGPQIFIYVRFNSNADIHNDLYDNLETNVFEAMALPDSGCTRTICNPGSYQIKHLAVLASKSLDI